MERTYNIPLRKVYLKAEKHTRTKKAMKGLREFLMKHMKCSNEQLKVGKKLNDALWIHGIKNPPHHVKVTAVKSDDGIVKVELFGFKYIEPVKSVSKEEKAAKPKSDAKTGDEKVVDAETDGKKVKKAKKSDKAAEENAEETEEKSADLENAVEAEDAEKPKAKKAPAKKASKEAEEKPKKAAAKKPAKSE
ncbi:MAG: 50S ribosomal protein L31e [Candidatus Woesearchaeota archaeon]|nr:50S ribosomal protein L31e [Candidatus Woesearchaeota archaeon]